MEYKLVLSGGSDMPLDRYEKNFSFIVNGQEIKTNRLIADFLSPIIFVKFFIFNNEYEEN